MRLRMFDAEGLLWADSFGARRAVLRLIDPDRAMDQDFARCF
jgi:hypothetical protein